MNYKVTIEATLRKALTIDAHSKEDAVALAEKRAYETLDFHPRIRNFENDTVVEVETIDVVPVQARSSITSVTTTDFATGEILENK